MEIGKWCNSNSNNTLLFLIHQHSSQPLLINVSKPYWMKYCKFWFWPHPMAANVGKNTSWKWKDVYERSQTYDKIQRRKKRLFNASPIAMMKNEQPTGEKMCISQQRHPIYISTKVQTGWKLLFGLCCISVRICICICIGPQRCWQ